MDALLIVLGTMALMVLMAGMLNIGRRQPPVVVVMPPIDPPSSSGGLGCLLVLVIGLLILALLRLI